MEQKLNELPDLVLKELVYRYQRKILDAENENLTELKAIQNYLVSIHTQLGNLITILDEIIERKLKENEENEI